MLDWCAESGLAAIPYGGGTSVVGGVEPRVGDATPAPSRSTSARFDRVLEVDEVSARGADPGRDARPGARGRAARARPHAPPLPAVLRVLDPRRLDRDPRRRALRDRSTPTSTTWSSRCARSRPTGEWESRRLPGSGAGPSPDRMLIGSEGTLGVITEAWVRVRPRPTREALLRRALRLASSGGAEAVRELVPVGAQPVELPPPRRARGRDLGRRRRLARASSSSASSRPSVPVDAPMERRGRDRRGPRRRARRGAGTAVPAPRPGTEGSATPSAPGAAPSSPRPTCATRSSPAA